VSNDAKPAPPVDPERIQKDNRFAFKKIRSMVPDLRAALEVESRILSCESPQIQDANPADDGK
jgi:hypothetical protein